MASQNKSPDEIRKKIQSLRLAYRRARYHQEQRKRKERTHKLCQVSAFVFRCESDLDSAYAAVKANDVRAYAEITRRLLQLYF